MGENLKSLHKRNSRKNQKISLLVFWVFHFSWKIEDLGTERSELENDLYLSHLKDFHVKEGMLCSVLIKWTNQKETIYTKKLSKN